MIKTMFGRSAPVSGVASAESRDPIGNQCRVSCKLHHGIVVRKALSERSCHVIQPLRLLLAVLTLPAAFAQDPSPATDPLGGANAPTPQLQLKREEQYKRVHQLALRYELLGRRDDARRFATDYLARHPGMPRRTFSWE